MPRPIDTSSKSAKMIIGGAIAAVLAATALTLAMCSTTGTTATNSTSNKAATASNSTGAAPSSTSATASTALKEIDSVGNAKALEFMSDTDREAFAKALHSWMDQNGRTWPDGCSVASVKNQTTSTAEIYVKLGDGTYICCAWVAGTANPFVFDSSNESEALGAGTSHSGSASSSAAQQQGTESAETATQGSSAPSGTGTSSGSAAAGSASGPSSASSGSSSSSGSGSSESTGKTPSNTSSPIKASDTDALMRKLPQKAAYYLPTVTENWLAGKGISATGSEAVVDGSTIAKGGVGYTFSGYVKDRSGTVRSLEWEWNESRQQYGMSLK